MEFRAFKLSDLIIALPAFHVFTTTLFIAGYYFAFYPDLALLASPGDLFSVSVKDIGRVYLFALLLPAITALIFRAQVGAWTYAGSVSQKPHEEKEKATQSWDSSKRTFRALLFVFTFLYTAIVVLHYAMEGYFSYSSLYMYVLIIFMVSNIWITNRIPTSDISVHIIFIVGAVLIYSLFTGLGEGQKDRRLTYRQALTQVELVCGNYRVLRPIGSYFIAVGPTGHVIIDPSCVPRFSVKL